MRKVYKNRNEEAVSPVIATILMVAITVVLAAVLYVMVIGMGGGGGATAPAGSVTFDKVSNSTCKVIFGAFSPVPAPMDVKFILTPNTGTVIEYTFPNAPTAAQTTMNPTTAVYYDNNYQGNAINSGDTLTINNLAPGMGYTLTIFHYDSDSLCSLVGTNTFTMPA